MPARSGEQYVQALRRKQPVHISFLSPTSRQQLIDKRKAFKLRTDHSFGFLGRSMDFMNNMVLNMHLGRERFAQRGQRFADNVTRYFEYVRENDLFLTHALINPQIDRARTSAEQEEPFLHLGKVRETPDGIVVRGAKMLATMAPITDEILCFPFGAGVAEGDDAYWERVFIDGNAGSREVANAAGGGTGLTGGVQTAARMLSQMEFFCGLAMKLAEVINITGLSGVPRRHRPLRARSRRSLRRSARAPVQARVGRHKFELRPAHAAVRHLLLR